jgi:hypothetical protein
MAAYHSLSSQQEKKDAFGRHWSSQTPPPHTVSSRGSGLVLYRSADAASKTFAPCRATAGAFRQRALDAFEFRVTSLSLVCGAPDVLRLGGLTHRHGGLLGGRHRSAARSQRDQCGRTDGNVSPGHVSLLHSCRDGDGCRSGAIAARRGVLHWPRPGPHWHSCWCTAACGCGGLTRPKRLAAYSPL